jgi:hypothetical protein
MSSLELLTHFPEIRSPDVSLIPGDLLNTLADLHLRVHHPVPHRTVLLLKNDLI